MMPKPLLRFERARRRTRCPVTVCVAAICQFEGNSVVIGASDRMITAGDIEFEQEQTKIINLTSSISIMVAGDLSIQSVILHELISEIQGRVEAKPQDWLRVKDVAETFQGQLAALTRKRAEEAILAPLGLDFSKLTSPAVAPALAEQLAKEVLTFQVPRIEALIIGLDDRPHIYEVTNDGLTCHDWTGFASVGGGAWHSNSQLMFAGHVKTRHLTETVMLVYTAKRRAEVAPGVGEATDMIVIGPRLGESTSIGEPLMSLLGGTYQEARKQAEEVRIQASDKIAEFFQKAVAEATVQPQSPAQLEAGSADSDGR
jgi:hypothetical protein